MALTRLSARTEGGMKTIHSRLLQTILAGVLASSLAACGGGGGDSGSTVTPPPPPASTAPVDVTVIDTLGRPVAGAALASSAGTASTGVDGHATVPVATGSEQVVSIDKAGFAEQVKVLALDAAATQGSLVAMIVAREAEVAIAGIENGGTASGRDGVKVTFPAAALVDAGGRPVTGTVQMAMTPLDVSNVDVGAFPGLFEGIPTGASRTAIASFGSSELVPQQNGVKLQLAAGKSAQIELPLYADHYPDGNRVAAGDSIALWSLDVTSGLWNQEGSGSVFVSAASPSGLAMRATIAHFSWWNADAIVSRASATVTVTATGATVPAGTTSALTGRVVAGTGPASTVSTTVTIGTPVTVPVPAGATTRLGVRFELATQVCQGTADVSPAPNTDIAVTLATTCVDVPVPSVVVPAAALAINSSRPLDIQVDVSGPAPDSVEVLIDGAPIAQMPAQFFYRTFWDSSTTPEGSHDISARATRQGAARTSDPVTVVVDRTPPQIFGVSPGPTAEVGSSTVFTVDFNEAVTAAPNLLSEILTLTVLPPGQTTPVAIPFTATLDIAGTHLTVTSSSTDAMPIGTASLGWAALRDAAGNNVAGTVLQTWNVSRTTQIGSSFSVNRRMRMTIDAAGVPYVVGQFQGNDISVIRFNGTDFVPMGPRANDFTAAGDPEIAVAPDGRVYVAFEQDTAVPGKGQVVVRTFDAASATWQPVGPVFATSVPGSFGWLTPHVLIDGAGRPILLFVSDDGLFSLKGFRFDGTAWQSLGVFGDSFFYDFTPKLDSSGNPVVLYLKGTGGSNAKQLTLARFDGTAWSLVANGFDSVPDATGGLGAPALALAADGSQWVAWSKFDGDGHRVATHLVHVAGTTVTDGNLPPDFLVFEVGLTTFGNEPVILGDNGGAADVRRFHNGAWEPKALMPEADNARFDVFTFGGEIVVGMNGAEGPSRVSRFRFPP